MINEYYSEHPIVNLKLFKDRTFTSGATVMFFVFLNLFGSIVLLPIYLQMMMGYTSFYAGLVLGPGGIATMFAMPIVGKFIGKVNPKRFLVVGISVCALSTYMMSRFQSHDRFLDLCLAARRARFRHGHDLHPAHHADALAHPEGADDRGDIDL